MKARLQTSLGQSLVMTPQLHQAIRLLQLSGAELEQELAEAVETNPLLEWAEDVPLAADLAVRAVVPVVIAELVALLGDKSPSERRLVRANRQIK